MSGRIAIVGETLCSGREEASDRESVREILPIGYPALERFFAPGSRKRATVRALGRYFQ